MDIDRGYGYRAKYFKHESITLAQMLQGKLKMFQNFIIINVMN